jgi:N-methylhydantoinase A
VATRIGVDVGGTFTDLIAYDDVTGEVRVAKGSSTPGSPDKGVAVVVEAGVPPEHLRVAEYFLHGTTVGINALVERNGAKVALLTTTGFRDVLESRRGDREAMYELLWKPRPPLVPRRLRVPITERVLANGTVDMPLAEDDVRAAVELFVAEDVEAVAIVFINAYANPVHELVAERVLRDSGFDGEISLSHRTSGEYREYERTSTTVIDAYVRPRVSNYLGRIERSLSERGFGGSLLVTSSGGGAMSFQDARERPFETVMSGPVAGAVGACELCRSLGIDLAITADVGGTSFDTCLIADGRVNVKYEGVIDGMPLQTPWVDVRSIGAGGGSIAFVDHGGLLRVGQRSAGAVPGPVCYGRGGTQPTVTDAAAVLGMLAFGELAAGVHLDVESARRSLEPLAERLSLDVEGVARGIMTIASEAMANAIRSVTIDQGHDARLATLVAFGGAGPLFSTLLSRALEIRKVIVPNYAGNFSAWGLLGQDLKQSAALTSIRALDASGIAAANKILQGLYERIDGAHGATFREPAIDLRYSGQEYTLTITPPATADGQIAVDASPLEELFAGSYERTFGHTLDQPVEIVVTRATARTPLPRRSQEIVVSGSSNGHARRTIDAYSFRAGARLPFDVVARSALTDAVAGPMIVCEETTTTYVDIGFDVAVDPTGSLILRDQAARGT